MYLFRSSVASLNSAIASVLAAGALAIAASPAVAQQTRVEGTWSGNGRVALQSGQAERARCRATIRRQTAGTFNMSAVCATASVRISQVARVQRVSANTFVGRFYNQEYDVSGTIRMALRGNRLSASLIGNGGSATFVLSR